MTEVAATRGGGRSVVNYRVGGREYPMVTVASCRVCNNPMRFDIEEAIVKGSTYRRIIESLPEQHRISIDSLKSHYPQHMPLDQAVTRQIIESGAERVGRSIEESAESLVDGITLAEVVVQKTFEAIAMGEIKPDVRDGMAAAKFLADMGGFDQGGMDQGAMVEAFMVYHEQAQAMMSPQQFQDFGRALSRNPVLRALASRYDGTPPDEGEEDDSDVVPGEVLDAQR